MKRALGTLSYAIGCGAAHGLAAWSSAYCAAEFLFASLLFALARPYSEFASWHWSLTWLLVMGFLSAGLVCGAVAGAAVCFFGDGQSRSKLEHAATLTLVLAFLMNIVLHPFSLPGWGWLFAGALGFAGLIALGMRLPKWHSRLVDRATTPNLRRLARDSVIYTRAMSASDFTLTSHASLFTQLPRSLLRSSRSCLWLPFG